VAFLGVGVGWHGKGCKRGVAVLLTAFSAILNKRVVK